MEHVQEKGWFAAGPMSEDEKRKAEALRLGVPFVLLGRDDISIDALVLIPEPLSRTANIVAYRHGEEGVEVALLDLADLPQIEFLRQTHQVHVRLTDRGSMKQALLQYQKHLKEKFAGMVSTGKEAAESLLKHAIHSGAHYVHLEPTHAEAAGLIVRYRIEGVLREAMRLPEDAARYITERIKSMAKLFPVTTTVQEGSFAFAHDGGEAHVALTTVPTAYGEKITMRLSHDRNGVAGFSLQSLGLHGDALERVHDALHARQGMVLVAGMSGSGKSTLLYTMLDHVSGSHRAVATVEKHIDYRLPHVHQTATRPDLGLGVAQALRAVLRQDPDTVMVSDLNDDAATVALAAAERGVFVLGGIDARSALGALDVLVSELGVTEKSLQAVRLVVAQRTLHRLAEGAQTRAMQRSEAELLEGKVRFAKVLAALKREGVVHEHTAWKDIAVHTTATDSAYKGLVGIQEVLEPAAPSDEALTLLEDALFKAVQGQTSIEEVVAMASE